MSQSVNKKRALDAVRIWNEKFPIGTVVEMTCDDGKVISLKTESHAALGRKDEPVVFVEGIQEPVPLQRLTVPGWERVRGRKK